MKLLIIGCGSIGCRHARVAAGTGACALALCDKNPEFLNAIASELGIAETYTDMDEAIRASHADAAVVCTPNHLHRGPVTAALRAGMDVLCEKPIATSVADADAMLAAAAEAGRKLMIGYTLRSTQGVRKVKELLDAGRIGRPVSARVVLDSPETLTCARSPFRASYETGGGIIYDYTHQIDFCRYFFGRAAGCFARVSSRIPGLAACDDSADGLVDYDGLTVNYHWDYIQGAGERRNYVTVIGETGAVEFCYQGRLTVFDYDGSTETWDLSSDHERNNSFRRQLELFRDYCAGGPARQVCTGEVAREDLIVADTLYRASREGRYLTPEY